MVKDKDMDMDRDMAKDTDTDTDTVKDMVITKDMEINNFSIRQKHWSTTNILTIKNL